MRLLPFSFLSIVLALPAFSTPVSFEKRGGTVFEARFPGGVATFRTDGVGFGQITLRFPGSSPKSPWEGVGEAVPATYISSGGLIKFPQYPKIERRGIYPGIDAIFYGSGSSKGEALEYDLALAPGASPERVRLAFDGAREVRIDPEGNLLVETAAGVLEQKVPRVFQAGGRRVEARYVLLGGGEVGIRLGHYDLRATLTIDPELVYTKYFGGSGADKATAIATDAQGNIYMAGISNSIDFPVANGALTNVDPPLLAITNSGKTVVPVYVGRETSVFSMGGTADGKILYALTPGGMYLSSNSGADWVRNAPVPGITSGNIYPQMSPGVIAVDPLVPSTLGVPTNGGLYFSNDTGQSWVLHDLGLPAGQNGMVPTSQVIISPVNHELCYTVAGTTNSIFKSTDGCYTWTPVNASFPGEAAPQPFPYSTITMAFGPNGSDLYAVDGNAILLKSTDGGLSWKGLAQGLFSSLALIVDPGNASNVFVLNNYGVQMSKDGGASFTTIVPRTLPGNPQPLQLQGMAWDSPANTLYVGLQNSLYYTTDNGATMHLVPQISTGTVHEVMDLGGTVYAAIDAVNRPFVMKLDPTGTQVLYTTFFGGGWADGISALKVDSQGNAYVAGSTIAPDFPATVHFSPTSPAGQSNLFLVKLSPDGTKMLYADELGVSYGFSLQSQGMALDAAGSVYITGQTSSKDFPTTQGSLLPAQPTAVCSRPQTNFFLNPNMGTYAFVSKLSADGSSLVYSTFLPGSCGSAGAGIAVDAGGEAIVTGSTTSPDFPASANAYQAAYPGDPKTLIPFTVGFIAKLSAAGDKVLAATYLGGGYGTQASSVVVDASGDIHVTGFTNGIAPGGTPGAYQAKVASGCAPTFSIGPGPPPTPAGDAFLLKLDPTLSTARYLTYLGGSCNESGTALAVDAAGNSWVMGLGVSADFPLVAPFQLAISGYFVAEFDPTASKLLFSSYTDANALTLDPSGVALIAGAGLSPSIPKRPQSFGTGTSVVLQKIDPAMKPPVEIDVIGPLASYPSPTVYPSVATVAPGQLIQIAGHNLGPAAKVDAKFDATGRLEDIVSGVTVKFDGIPAPLISVQDGMIECFVPFEVAQYPQVTVTNNGQTSNSVRIYVGPQSPQMLSVFNQDGTPNSSKQPAKVGSVIAIYVSGLGVTTPPSLDGFMSSYPLPVPAVPVTVYVSTGLGNNPQPGGPSPYVQPLYAGAAPGLIAGITQVNIQIPPGTYASNGATVGVNASYAPLYVIP
ncbi:MAG TPA: SBBP repeat-containing protein [Bryobacteraceae bacterium]